MKFTVKRKNIIKPLQRVTSLLVTRSTLPILNHLLLEIKKNYLIITGTNLEIELVVKVALDDFYIENDTTTIPGRKFFDICRALPEDSNINVSSEQDRMLIYSGHSRYVLSTLPSSNYPNIEQWNSKLEFKLSQIELKQLIESTYFSMANNDSRYYLNGMLFETKNHELRTVATDGHRLAMSVISTNEIFINHSVIVPRKSIIELIRILNNNKNLVLLQIGDNNIRINIIDYIFTTKLIDGNFPDYRSIFPDKTKKILKTNCNELKQAIIRAAIISKDQCQDIKFNLYENKLKITANNSENEEAEELLKVDYQEKNLEISFNADYILDVLNVLKTEKIKIQFTDENSCMQITDYCVNPIATYVIMPMRL